MQDSLIKKGYEGSIEEINLIDKKYRMITKNLEESRAKKNVVSQQVAESKRNGFNAIKSIITHICITNTQKQGTIWRNINHNIFL